MVRSLTRFFGLTMGTIASIATTAAVGLTPFDFASAISLSLISRDEVAMSVDLSISALIPSPDPPPESEIFAPGFAFM